ncbi:MAG: hypothetical protein HZC36_01320 [Armatimonadetes bacterium]|nr:hypothetical protein [Armatimonadota bacterium]
MKVSWIGMLRALPAAALVVGIIFLGVWVGIENRKVTLMRELSVGMPDFQAEELLGPPVKKFEARDPFGTPCILAKFRLPGFPYSENVWIVVSNHMIKSVIYTEGPSGQDLIGRYAKLREVRDQQ